jgi:predicted RNase H-like HicB family nuclease
LAISKILYIGDCGGGYSGKHLRQALDYIMDREKTCNGKWVSSLNCQEEYAYQQMYETKKFFGKTDQRQGYHLIISFVEGEVDAQTAFEVIGKFAKEYLGLDYEAVYTVHDNTEHIHGHIIFNSVSFRTGKKYRYEKGDWARKIQPITNRLCEAYGLSTIEIEEDRARRFEHYKEWNDFRDGKFVWADMIKRDLDACILQTSTYEDFLAMMKELGYEIKNAYREEGKYLALKPMGLTRFRRCKTLGEEYGEERIRERIQTEQLSSYYNRRQEKQPRLVYCKVKRYRRAKLSGIQRRYFAKLYRTGQLKKRPYSQAWKYREDIRRMKQIQEEYLFLSRHNIKQGADILAVTEQLTEKKKETAREKSKVFKARARLNPLFDLAKEREEVQEGEACFQRGETFFTEEHERFVQIEEKLKKEGYTLEQLSELKEHYRNEIARIRGQEAAVLKEERTAKRILSQLQEKGREKEKKKQREGEKEREKQNQEQQKKNRKLIR